jgi:hypothetical protein
VNNHYDTEPKNKFVVNQTQYKFINSLNVPTNSSGAYVATNQNEYNPTNSNDKYSSKNPVQSQPNVSSSIKEKDKQQSSGLM